jgi:hypothetical protein
MRTRNTVTTAVVFFVIAVAIGMGQAIRGSSGLFLGPALAAPWIAAGVVILVAPRVGAWLGLFVSAIYFVASLWLASLFNVGEGREIARLLFSGGDGIANNSAAFILSLLLVVGCLWCAGATVWLLRHAEPRDAVTR